ncbi:hypothetical protein E2320_020639, partial [Naja naja]
MIQASLDTSMQPPDLLLKPSTGTSLCFTLSPPSWPLVPVKLAPPSPPSFFSCRETKVWEIIKSSELCKERKSYWMELTVQSFLICNIWDICVLPENHKVFIFKKGFGFVGKRQVLKMKDWRHVKRKGYNCYLYGRKVKNLRALLVVSSFLPIHRREVETENILPFELPKIKMVTENMISENMVY